MDSINYTEEPIIITEKDYEYFLKILREPSEQNKKLLEIIRIYREAIDNGTLISNED